MKRAVQNPTGFFGHRLNLYYFKFVIIMVYLYRAVSENIGCFSVFYKSEDVLKAHEYNQDDVSISYVRVKASKTNIQVREVFEYAAKIKNGKLIKDREVKIIEFTRPFWEVKIHHRHEPLETISQKINIMPLQELLEVSARIQGDIEKLKHCIENQRIFKAHYAGFGGATTISYVDLDVNHDIAEKIGVLKKLNERRKDLADRTGTVSQ